MAGLSDTIEDAIVNHFLGKIAWAKPPAVYAAAMTVAPNDAGVGGTEVAGGAYVRVEVTSKMTASAGGASTNNVEVTFVEATAAWGNVVGIAFYDAAAAGTFLDYMPLTVAKPIAAGDRMRFAPGKLTVTAAD